MFGLKTRPTIPTDDAFLGDQIRGFGFTHDGAVPTIFNFMSITTGAGGFNHSSLKKVRRRTPACGNAPCRNGRSKISSSPSTAT
jgi:hypothetical protein